MSRITATTVLTATLGILLFGCGRNPSGLQPPGAPRGIALSVQGAHYATNDTIRMTLDNGSAHQLGYNLCAVDLQRRSQAGWVNAQRYPDPAACTAELQVLQPGHTVTGSQIVYPFVQPGTYRFQARLEWPINRGTATVVSSEFTVVP